MALQFILKKQHIVSQAFTARFIPRLIIPTLAYLMVLAIDAP
jgi:hypothetical protein